MNKNIKRATMAAVTFMTPLPGYLPVESLGSTVKAAGDLLDDPDAEQAAYDEVMADHYRYGSGS